MTQQPGAYDVEVTSANAYAQEPGSTIAYRLRVSDAQGQPVPLSLENVTSAIQGQGYRQTLPPTSRDGDWYTIAMHIPYGARISMGLLFAVAMFWVTDGANSTHGPAPIGRCHRRCLYHMISVTRATKKK